MGTRRRQSPTDLAPTSRDASRYSLHETSVPIQVETISPDGIAIIQQEAVAATLDRSGAPLLHPGLVARLDRGRLRPGVRAYLASGDAHNDDRLAPLLPLDLEEARALLRHRYPLLAQAVERCFFGTQSLEDLAKEQHPPRTRQTIWERKEKGLALLARWTGQGQGFAPDFRPTCG